MNSKRLVHLDLKGSVPKLKFLLDLLPLFSQWGATGILVEYEDTFPYDGELCALRKKQSYSKSDIETVISECQRCNLEVIPLIQTIGHFEFVLKHEKFAYLRENHYYPMTLCPSCEESVNLVKAMLSQVMRLHNSSAFLHIGADEVAFPAQLCPRCSVRKLSPHELYLQHIHSIADFAKSHFSCDVIMWDDMFRQMEDSLIVDSGLANKVQVMIWHYASNFELSMDYIDRLYQLFGGAWGASAFKGASGPCQLITPTKLHIENTLHWVKIHQTKPLFGIAITGWSRFDHFSIMCELLPVGLPSLCLCLKVLENGLFTPEIHSQCSQQLGFPGLIPWVPHIEDCNPEVSLAFPGWEIYQAVHALYKLHCDFVRIQMNELRQSHMSKFHCLKQAANSGVVLQLVTQMKLLLNKFEMWRGSSLTFFQNQLSAEDVEEWVMVNALLKEQKLNKWIREGMQLLAVGDSTPPQKLC